MTEKKEMCYFVECVTYSGYHIYNSEFEEPLYYTDFETETLRYKPTMEEIKQAYGKGWEEVERVIITTYFDNDTEENETIKNKDFFLYHTED